MDSAPLTLEDGKPSTTSRGHRVRRRLMQIIIVLLVLYLLWLCIAGSRLQERLIFPAHLAPPSRTTLYSSDTAVVCLTTSHGRAEAWFIPARGIGPDKPGPAAVFFHGNGEIIDYQEDTVAGYLSIGCSVFLPEYRGYGRSSGKPSQQAIGEDAVRFYDELAKRPDVDKSRIFFHGSSLGGGVAADLATRRKPAALILQSTMRSVTSVALRAGVPPFVMRHPFHTDRVVASCDVPILIFHGSKDRIIPVSHGRRLHALAPRSGYVEFACGHNDLPDQTTRADYWAAIRDFLSRHGIIEKSVG